MAKKTKTVIACLVSALYLTGDPTSIAHAKNTVDFESYQTKNSTAIHGHYTLNYVLRNYNLFVRENFSKQHVVGPVIIGGEFTGDLGGCAAGKTDRYPHQVSSYIGQPTHSMNVNAYNSNIYFYMHPDAKPSGIKIWATPTKYISDFVDFNEAMTSFVQESISLGKQAITVSPTKEASLEKNHYQYLFTEDNQYELQVQSGHTYDITGLTNLDRINVISTADLSNEKDIIIYSEDKGEIKGLNTYYDGKYMTPTEAGDNTGIVYLYPYATKYIGAKASQDGHLVAPRANVEINAGNFNGCVIANNVKSKGEGHMYPYNGKSIPETPKESSLPEIKYPTIDETNEIEWETVEPLEPFNPESGKAIEINEAESNEIEWETVEPLEPFNPESGKAIEINEADSNEIKWETTEPLEPFNPEEVKAIEINEAESNEIEWETVEPLEPFNPEEGKAIEINEAESNEIEWETVEPLEPFNPESGKAIEINEAESNEIKWETAEPLEPFTPEEGKAIEINEAESNEIKWETAEPLEPFNPESGKAIEINEADSNEIEWETAEPLEPFNPEEGKAIEINEAESNEIEWETTEPLEPFTPESGKAIQINEAESNEIEWETVEPLEPFTPEEGKAIEINEAESNEIKWETVEPLEPFTPEEGKVIEINEAETGEIKWETTEPLEPFTPESGKVIEINEAETGEIKWETAEPLEPFTPEEGKAIEINEAETGEIKWETAEPLEPFTPEEGKAIEINEAESNEIKWETAEPLEPFTPEEGKAIVTNEPNNQEKLVIVKPLARTVVKKPIGEKKETATIQNTKLGVTKTTQPNKSSLATKNTLTYKQTPKDTLPKTSAASILVNKLLAYLLGTVGAIVMINNKK